MGDHADLTARLRRPRKVWVNGSAMTIMQPDDVYRDMVEAADALDAADAENARLRAALFDVTHAVMQEAEAHRYGQPAYDMTLDHLYEIADHHRSVLAVSEEATDV